MRTVAEHIDGGAVTSEGRAVIAWGYGRMRYGVILNVGRKNAKLELVQNANHDTYVKSVPLGEVFLVPDGGKASGIADWLNTEAIQFPKEADYHRRSRVSISYDRAHELAKEFA